MPVAEKWFVKQATSGDTVVLRGLPRGGPPPEITVGLSGVSAPRLGRREFTDSTDEPFAWEAREFLRKLTIGKEVNLNVEHVVSGQAKRFGQVFLGPASGEGSVNVAEAVVTAGYGEVRKAGRAGDDALAAAEASAREAKLGRWSAEDPLLHVRPAPEVPPKPVAEVVNSLMGQRLDAVIEQVRDAGCYRLTLLPSHTSILVQLTGIRAPQIKQEGPEPFAEEARFFAECRLLHRDIKVVIEGTASPSCAFATLLHPNGNISTILLKEGYAKCVDWSMAKVTQDRDSYRSSEAVAKAAQLRVWKDYTPTAPRTEEGAFSAHVLEIVSADCLVVKPLNGAPKKIFLASIRPPRLAEGQARPEPGGKQRFRPLYDIPYMFEAREFLRKKLIGKKVEVKVDYVQPEQNNFPQKTCCSISLGSQNIGEVLLAKGFGSCVFYRQDDERRAANYDALLQAEERAKKKACGIHSKDAPPTHRVADLASERSKAQQFLPFMQRAGRTNAIVEYITAGNRFRVYIPKETCIATLIVAGITCPSSGGRPDAFGQPLAPEPFGEESLRFAKERLLQREVEILVETSDRGGNFLGWLFLDGVNYATQILAAGLARLHPLADRSEYARELTLAEKQAREVKQGVWSVEDTSAPVVAAPIDDSTEREVKRLTVTVGGVHDDGRFSVTAPADLERLQEALTNFQEEYAVPPVVSTGIKRGGWCAVKPDKTWVRGKLDAMLQGGQARVLLVDSGAYATLSKDEVYPLTHSLQACPPAAKLCSLACVSLPSDEEYASETIDAMANDITDVSVQINVEYRDNGIDFVTLYLDDADYAKLLLRGGFLVAEKRRERRLQSLVTEYLDEQQEAKNARRNIWRYGDFTADED